MMIVLLLSIFPPITLTVNAAKEVASGTCGDDLSWSLDTKGMLTISGNGEMYDYAFTSERCPPWNAYENQIRTIVISEGVTSIGQSAFADMFSLKKATLPAGLLSIGGSAFQSCTSLESIFIPASVESIGYTPFLGCRNLSEIKVDSNNLHYSSDAFGVLFDKQKTKLLQFPGKIDGTYHVPSSVVWVGYGFCENLTNINIPSSVETIKFYGSTDGNFKGFIVDENNKNYSNDSFGVLYTKDKSQLIRMPEGLSGHYAIPDSTTTIQSDAFSPFGKITSLEIPVSVITIERFAFSCVKNIANVYYKGTKEQWNQVFIGSGNEEFLNTTIHYESSPHSDQSGFADSTSDIDYLTAVEQAIEDNQNYGWGSGYGALYDIDGNGIEELIMVYSINAEIDDEYGFPAKACSLYTMSNGKAVQLIDKKILFTEVGGPSGHVAVVKHDGNVYFATTSENGEMVGSGYSNRRGSWELFAIDGRSIKTEFTVKYNHYRGDDNKSSATINNKACSYKKYEEWKNGLLEILRIDPYENEEIMTLEELYAFLKGHEISSGNDSISSSGKGTNTGYHFELFSPNQELVVEKGKHIQIICKLYFGDQLITDWEQPGVSIGNADSASYVACERVNGGYCLTLKGNKEGTATLTLFDAESDTTLSTLFDIVDSSSTTYNYLLDQVPCGYPDSFWDRDVLTNFYNFNGLYVTGLEKPVEPVNGVYHLSFNVYNARYMHGSVDVYNQAGEWIRSVRIDKNANVRGVWDTVKNSFFVLCDLAERNGSFTSSLSSMETIVNIDIPEGGYFVITNNYYESPAVYLYNGIDYAIYAANKTLDFTITSESIKDIQDKTIQQVLKSPEFIDTFQNIVLNNASEMAVDASANVLTVNLADSAGNMANEMIGILDEIGINFWDVTASVTDIAVDVFTSFLPPQISQALDFMFTTSEVTDLIGQLDNIAKSYRKPYIRIYTIGGCRELTVEGVTATPSDNSLPDNAVLQVSRIANAKTLSIPEINLETNEYKLYDISYSSDGVDVQPDGSVGIQILVPEEYDWDKHAVLHQQNDGTWEVVDCVVEDETIVFQVDHFSLFAVVDGDLVQQNKYSISIILFATVVTTILIGSICLLCLKKRKISVR